MREFELMEGHRASRFDIRISGTFEKTNWRSWSNGKTEISRGCGRSEKMKQESISLT